MDHPEQTPDDAGPQAPGSVLQGTVELVTFHNPESLYSVLKVSPESGYDDPESTSLFRAGRVAAVGAVEGPGVGMRLRLFGAWSSHRSHGRQFEFDSYEPVEPADADGVVRYLASSAFEGIGETLAQRIVDALGSGALAVIREHPERLEEVKGLKPAVRESLTRSVAANQAQHQLQIFLRGIGLGPRQSAAISKRFGESAEAVIRRDPYVIAGSVRGIGFALADRVALELGFARDGVERFRAALLHCLRDAAGSGHTLLGESRLMASARELIELDPGPDTTARALDDLEREREVVLESDAEERSVYLPHLAASEAGLAASLRRLIEAGTPTALADEERVRKAEELTGLSLDPDQRAAVLGLLGSSVSLMTGGPGVGKTTIVRLLVEIAEASGARVLLASPTGRAAKRLAEATGRKAGTLHRTLGFDPQTGGFAKDREHPLEADLLVVDEVSMLDVVLAHHVFKAVEAPTRVVLVGDPDQLPSVSPGNVLRDMIDSGALPCHRLTRIHRQQRESRIVVNAHNILTGDELELPPRGDTSSDFYLFPEEDAQSAADRVVEVVSQRIPRAFGLDWARDVQVLAPMYRGACGVDELNARLRDARTGGDVFSEVTLSGRTWRVGDRVIQTRNDYDRQVFNGDMGLIERVGDEGLVVRYPEQDVAYPPDGLSDLQLAFAITVHRAQGSEYPAVVIPLVNQHFMMLQRNLLYTAVTRARKLVVIVGSRRALRTAIDNAEPNLRLSGLAGRLAGVEAPR